MQEGYLRIGGGACYRLVGAVIHYRYGNNSGHYTSYFLDHGQKQWFLADDGMVSGSASNYGFISRYVYM